ncbi:MAG: hypothetical protein ACXWT0_03900 [Methylobacter sp.]
MRGIQLSLDDLFKDLPLLSHERKMAVAFAVYADLSLTDVVSLKWSDELELTWRAQFILAKLPVSERVDYVFWEKIGRDDVKMSSLPYWFGIATLWRDWVAFSQTYRDSIPIEFGPFWS